MKCTNLKYTVLMQFFEITILNLAVFYMHINGNGYEKRTQFH